MEIEEDRGYKKNEVEEEPSLFKIIKSNQLVGFDSFETNDEQMIQPNQQTRKTGTTVNSGSYASISLPATPNRQYPPTPKKVIFNDQHNIQIMPDTKLSDASSNSGTSNSTQSKSYSQPMPRSATHVGAPSHTNSPLNPQRTPRSDRPRDTRYDTFKTWSGKLEKQLSTFRGKPVEPDPDYKPVSNSEGDALPVARYFDALHGPELDRLRPSEELILPEDKNWPFLLRFPISSFGICLGVSSQAILWKTIATSIGSLSKNVIKVSNALNMVLWSISIALMVTVASIYALKLIFYFEAVRREYYHPIRVNFFFAPFIALLFLVLGIPPAVTETLPQALWYILMIPFLILELKIYGQWMSGGQRRLSKVANPSNHLSVVGNFVGALLGASMGLKEGPIFFFAVGLAHYTVLFVTLYQRLPTNDTLPKELHPVFFLFVAAPSVASMAWAKIQGSFDYGARIAYFIALFLYFSLAVRINFFRGFRFSLAWWAYTFPMTGAAIATLRYSNEVTNWVTRSLAIVLSIVSMFTVTGLLVTTLLHAFVFRKLFPNDIAIAISDRPPKSHKSWFNLRNVNSDDTKDIENYLKFINPNDGKDLESSADTSSSN